MTLLRYRLIATDLDGTLLSKGVVSPRNKAALRAARDARLDVVLVTGRPPAWVDQTADELALDGVAICSNGAMFYDLASRAVVSRNLVPADILRRLVEALRGQLPGVGFAYQRVDDLVLEPHFRYAGNSLDDVPRDIGDAVLDVPVAKLLASNPAADFETFLRAVAEVAGTDVVVTHSGDPGLVEVNASGVTKALAPRIALCESGGRARARRGVRRHAQ